MWVTSKPVCCDVVSKLSSLIGVSGLERSRGGGIGTHKAGSWQGKPQAAPLGAQLQSLPMAPHHALALYPAWATGTHTWKPRHSSGEWGTTILILQSRKLRL